MVLFKKSLKNKLKSLRPLKSLKLFKRLTSKKNRKNRKNRNSKKSKNDDCGRADALNRALSTLKNALTTPTRVKRKAK
jgi:hypothetical protein